MNCAYFSTLLLFSFLKYDNEGDRNPYLQNMIPNVRVPYCKPFWSDKESNNFGYPLSLT